MKTIYLGLGSNLGNRVAQLEQAVTHLKEHMTVTGRAPLYETRPFGCSAQPNFLNSAVSAQTDLNPAELKALVKTIEAQMGRVARTQNGAREIDIDILLYEDLVFEAAGITIPHIGLSERDFVLQPLLDLNPNLVHSRSGKPLASYLAALKDEDRYIVRHVPTVARACRLAVSEPLVQIQKHDVIVIDDVLPPGTIDYYLNLVRQLDYTEQPKEVGKRRVRQDVWSTRVVRWSELDYLADDLEAAVTACLGAGVFDTPLRFNHRNVQRYAHGSHGIDRHRDHKANYNLIALFGIGGEGTFNIYDELEGPAKLEVVVRPNSLLLMKGPGFCGKDTCPVHRISNVVGSDDGQRYLLGLRQNDNF